MNKREKIILIATVIVIVLGAGLKFMPEDFVQSSFAGGDVAAARTSLRQQMDQLSYGPSIAQAYDKLNTQLPETVPGRTQELTFSDEVTRILNEQGWPTPTVKPYKAVEIPKVSSYYYIDLEVTVTGEYDKITNLMIKFHEKNILIKEFKIEKNNMDQNQVTLNVKVSRLGKYSETTKRKPSRRNTASSRE